MIAHLGWQWFWVSQDNDVGVSLRHMHWIWITEKEHLICLTTNASNCLLLAQSLPTNWSQAKPLWMLLTTYIRSKEVWLYWEYMHSHRQEHALTGKNMHSKVTCIHRQEQALKGKYMLSQARTCTNKYTHKTCETFVRWDFANKWMNTSIK